MRVLVLHSDVSADAAPDDLDTLSASQAIATALRDAGHNVSLAPIADSPQIIGAEIRSAAPDAVFNMVESFCGQDSLAAVVPAILDKLGIPYTGSGAAALALAGDKPLAKRVLRSAGLSTPDWVEAPDWNGIAEGTRYIVKSATEDASLGLDDQSVVSGRRAVEDRTRRCTERFGGRWFAEAYIEGREFNVAAVAEGGKPRVLPIPEMRFEDWPADRPRIVGYRAKWDEESRECEKTVRTFGLEDEASALAMKLAEQAQTVWHLFGVRGYVRVDFRVDSFGKPMILEINPNPCLESKAGMAAAAAAAGISYGALVEQILMSASSGSARHAAVERRLDIAGQAAHLIP